MGKASSQVCIITAVGELIERRIKTDREHIYELLGKRSPARVLIESSTESQWVARYLEDVQEGTCDDCVAGITSQAIIALQLA